MKKNINDFEQIKPRNDDEIPTYRSITPKVVRAYSIITRECELTQESEPLVAAQAYMERFHGRIDDRIGQEVKRKVSELFTRTWNQPLNTEDEHNMNLKIDKIVKKALRQSSSLPLNNHCPCNKILIVDDNIFNIMSV